MITNPDIIKSDMYKCNKYVKGWLIFYCRLPLLSFDRKYFYFAKTDKLKECLKKMPLDIKILSKFSR